ncbi:divergent polysaccharide deacetylase family protein [Capillibacterium thermochitinicola]|uniref:Divergent polysaccharide deacetylase family protein n=1 Tax=Capillibacterium thermochitinicola TaxID=2699427 RepID=A0A8J6I1X3_9FIRM|nr:divergent polysaccharide deacetylase family protein [Capillibacterium thermochitinicola]MBA2133194.1 divergent polysaccharide deacetylase family protein [Capillibacterium thermochitinicola]
MTPQLQTNLPLSPRRSFRHRLLPLLLIAALAGQYLLWSAVIPPVVAPRSSQPDSGLAGLKPGFTPTVQWLLSMGRPEPFIPRRPEPPAPRPETPVQPRARVAIIIDDLGFVQEATEAFWELEIPLTFAVLPWGRYSEPHAREAIRRKQEVILHLPLEPLDPQTDPGPGVLRTDFTPEQLRRQIRANLAAVPGITGVNNHMGSKGTQDRRLMQILMAELKKAGLFFVDSRTIHTSVAATVAREYGVPTAVRDVFLDGSGLETFPVQIDLLIEKALAQGAAIGIAHTRPGVAAALKEAIPRFEAAGIELVHVSVLVK